MNKQRISFPRDEYLDNCSPKKDIRDKQQPQQEGGSNRKATALYYQSLPSSKYKLRGIVKSLAKQSLKQALKGKMKKGFKIKKTSELLGCSWEFFVSYFKSKMDKGMSWQAFLDGKIHISHVKPCSKFNLAVPKHQSQCFHYTNLQPTWAASNIIKGDTWTV